MDVVNFMEHECVSLENETIQLLISRSVGPRILSLKFTDGENVFAELPDFVGCGSQNWLAKIYGDSFDW